MTVHSVDDAVEILRRAHRALVTGHRRPDGDSLGSELAVAELAGELGTQTLVMNHDPAPPTLRDLPGVDSVMVSDSLPDDFADSYDLVVMLECPTIDRAGFDGLDLKPVLNIDHHPANPCYGAVNFLDEQAPAVGEMVWRMYRAAGVTPSPDAATNAYVALSTDTGDFRYSNATGRAFLAAAEMVESGARPDAVAQWIHGRKNVASVRLLGEALQTLEFSAGGMVASLQVDEAAFRRAGAQPEDTEEIINHPRSIDGVKAVAFFKKWEPEVVRVSLRSKGEVDVRVIAARFGGGGHHNASGCTIDGDIETAKRRLLEMLDDAVSES
jgi:phosphoesterase RecJ-like protein